MIGRTILAMVMASASMAAAGELTVQVTAEADGTHVPLCAEVDLPSDVASAKPGAIAVTMAGPDGATVPGQVVKMGDGPTRVAWVAPTVAGGKTQTWTATLKPGAPAAKKAWRFEAEEGKHVDRLFGERPVTRYMHEVDTSTKDRTFDTAKVFHHVFNAAGEPITKGAGGKYPHHRGIFLGYSKTGYDGGKRSDWWHVRNVAQRHQEMLATSAGPVLGASTMLIHWNDGQGKPVVIEERTTVAYRQPDPTLLLLDFRSTLRGARGKVELNGDPEHAGMQYRPANEVDYKFTKYLFPDEAITTKNVKKHLDLQWAAECYKLAGKIYTVQHMNHPDNPEGTKYSAYRNYGRFGAFPKTEIPEGGSVTLKYRLWVASGEFPSRQELQARWAAFAKKPKAVVK